MKIYIAHQISGLTPEQVIDYFESMARYMKAIGFEVLQPMTAKGYFRPDPAHKEQPAFKPDGYAQPVSTNHAIVERDNWMVHMADVVHVDFTGTTSPSIGMIMELAWAHELRKHTVIVLPEGNPHRHAFILECADVIFPDMAASMEYLVNLAKQEIGNANPV